MHYEDERFVVAADTQQVSREVCPACGTADRRVVQEAFFGPSSIVRCTTCRTEYLDPQPSDERLNEIYGPSYYEPWHLETSDALQAMKQATFTPILDACSLRGGSLLLDVGCADGALLEIASRTGARTFGVDLNERAIERACARVPDGVFHAGRLEDHPFGASRFDAVTMVDFIEHARDPATELQAVRSVMGDDAKLVLSTPWASSNLARLMRSRWPQYREEHLSYFSRAGMERILGRCGFEVVRISRTRKSLTLAYIHGQAEAFHPGVMSQMTGLAYRLVPFLRHRPVGLYLGEMTVVATPARSSAGGTRLS